MLMNRIDAYAPGLRVSQPQVAMLIFGASPLRIFSPPSLSTKSNAFVSGCTHAMEDRLQLTHAKYFSNPCDGRYIGAQDALLGAGGKDGVMPYISKTRGNIR